LRILIKVLKFIWKKCAKIHCLINISSKNGDLSFDLEPMLDLAINYERSSKSCLKNCTSSDFFGQKRGISKRDSLSQKL
jgi:hypothetical protein